MDERSYEKIMCRKVDEGSESQLRLLSSALTISNTADKLLPGVEDQLSRTRTTQRPVQLDCLCRTTQCYPTVVIFPAQCLSLGQNPRMRVMTSLQQSGGGLSDPVPLGNGRHRR